LDLAQAIQVVAEGLKYYPEQAELIAESNDLAVYKDSMVFSGPNF
jgi:hypothetical protein